MKFITLFNLFLVCTMCQAQTKVIAHKSHSGSSRSFSKAYQQNLFNINQSNFGDPGKRNFVVLDKVIALNDSVTVLKIKESIVCYHPWNTAYTDLKDFDFRVKSDTVIHHPVFIKENTVSSIKSSGKYYGRFDNNLDSVIFIGFKE